MITIDKYMVSDREEGGKLLGAKLQAYKGTDAVVVGIPMGGVIVAARIAVLLDLPLEVFPCRAIKHPADKNKSIGSVSLDEVAVQGTCHDMPQNYISHQLALLRSGLQSEWQNYFSNNPPIPLRYKTVIVVDDVLRPGDSIITCLKSIRKQNPLKIIVAVPIVSAEAVRQIGGLADEVVFVQMGHEVTSGNDFYVEFPTIELCEVKALLRDSKREMEV